MWIMDGYGQEDIDCSKNDLKVYQRVKDLLFF